MEEKLQAILTETFAKSIEDSTNEELYLALLQLTKNQIKPTKAQRPGRKLYYISAEFLIGKLLSNNLINLGLYDQLEEILSSHGRSLKEAEEAEPEPSLGNGGLGRLAACFLDSVATLGLNGDGVGLCYHFGLFRQLFLNNKQTETPDPWIAPESWLGKTKISFEVPFDSFTLKSTLYDVDIIGYGGHTNKLRLFDVDTVDETLVKNGITFDKEDIAHNLTLFLYPDDSDENGKLLRIYQQYFMVSNAAQLILQEALEKGVDLNELDKHVAVQINDTHPTMVIPELIRLLTEKGIPQEKAIDIVAHTCAYTNHTILAEALETWPLEYLEKVVPQLVPIIKVLDARVKASCEEEKVWIIDEDKEDGDESGHLVQQAHLVHMAHIAIHNSFSVNGVAALHTEILKSDTLKPFYELYPEKFNNKTNGITFRRWLLHCSPSLTKWIDGLIGEGYKKDAEELEKLLAFCDNEEVLVELLAEKQAAKLELKRYLLESQNIEIDENSIYDIQVKRLHEYKRQQMNALYAIWKYFDIKSGKIPARPITLIFGAKAAPSYVIAKDIIHLILCLQELINSDPAVCPWLKLVMVENYNIEKAEKLIPACDISEQISLASKEASGTGNMKFMLNGAITLGTMDGANVEICDLVGDDNIYIFGKTSDEVIDLYANETYDPLDFYDKDTEIEELVDFIINKKLIRIGDPVCLARLYKELISKDWFMTLGDLKAYIVAKEKAFADYEDRPAWSRKMLINIAKAGFFSSDRAISQYNKDIWKL